MNGIFSNELRDPKIEIPITYNLGWWSYQDEMIIQELIVEVVDSRLNLFNSNSIISYTIKGTFKSDERRNLKIKEVHISERLNKDTSQIFSRIIELTPVVESIEGGDKNNVNFEFTNEHLVKSGGWGMNRFNIICGDKEYIAELAQLK